MRFQAVITLGEFLLKCRDCGKEFTYVTGSNLLNLGDSVDGQECPLCKKRDIFTVQTPTVVDYDTTN